MSFETGVSTRPRVIRAQAKTKSARELCGCGCVEDATHIFENAFFGLRLFSILHSLNVGA